MARCPARQGWIKTAPMRFHSAARATFGQRGPKFSWADWCCGFVPLAGWQNRARVVNSGCSANAHKKTSRRLREWREPCGRCWQPAAWRPSCIGCSGPEFHTARRRLQAAASQREPFPTISSTRRIFPVGFMSVFSIASAAAPAIVTRSIWAEKKRER